MMAKKFKYQLSIFTALLSAYFLGAQNLDLTLYPEDFVTSHWKEVNTASLDISEVAFVNWNSGGSNSISGLIGFEAQRNYKKDHLLWENRAVIRYGVNKQQSQSLRKTDDIFELKSRFGFRKDIKSNWYYSANFSFATQFTNGYNYSNSDEKPISQFMAPAYMFLGVGTVYGEHIEEFSAYMSPLTLKSTFVLDQDLADAGSFGVTPAVYDDLGNRLSKGENSREEVGILVTSAYENALMENISVRTLVSLYTDYLNDFGNVDIDWELNFKFKVNDHVRATMGSHIKYDNDVKTAIEDEDMPEEIVVKGAKVQWKQLLGVGVSVDF
ncbi:DUF3078 domain-containing protein [Pontimicrobium sp. SW4]|uniref:DUF3078 domain-containing protein n=1 Tax=Pontimicrobium sp. SW4 TaxID=3153519 RepID=A0AAU7BQ15_9FLAO